METQIINGGYKVPVDSHIGAWQIQEQRLDHAPWLAEKVCEHLKLGDFVIEGGAFNGDHSIQYSRAIGDRGMLIAVEAGKLAFTCLLHNVALFQNPKNTYALHTALSDIDGASVSHEESQNLGGSICKGVEDKDRVAGSMYILTTTVDTLVHKAEKTLNFLKLDIEGYEFKALLGAAKTLKRDRPGLLLEMNSAALMLQGDTCDDIYQLLNAFNYSWEICQPDLTSESPMYDILALPKPIPAV